MGEIEQIMCDLSGACAVLPCDEPDLLEHASSAPLRSFGRLCQACGEYLRSRDLPDDASEEMPSRRTLSALLGVNPNTIQKAYRFLEEEGIIESRAGAKSYIMVDEKRREVIRQEFLHYEIEQSAKALQSLGISREEAVEMFTAVWCELEENTIPHSASGSETHIRGK